MITSPEKNKNDGDNGDDDDSSIVSTTSKSIISVTKVSYKKDSKVVKTLKLGEDAVELPARDLRVSPSTPNPLNIDGDSSNAVSSNVLQNFVSELGGMTDEIPDLKIPSPKPTQPMSFIKNAPVKKIAYLSKTSLEKR